MRSYPIHHLHNSVSGDITGTPPSPLTLPKTFVASSDFSSYVRRKTSGGAKRGHNEQGSRKDGARTRTDVSDLSGESVTFRTMALEAGSPGHSSFSLPIKYGSLQIALFLLVRGPSLQRVLRFKPLWPLNTALPTVRP